MSTYTQILYQLVFGPRAHQSCLKKNHREQLFRYMWGILENNKCHVYRINGVEDHLHIITHVHPTIALSQLISDLKLASSAFISEQHLFPGFDGWQEGYGAFTYSIKEKDRLIDYVINQEAHHEKTGFREEYRSLLKEHDITFDEKYLL
ncbi:MAG: IS200/IS605 family transposase [Bacteroidetes bacterium]|nr:IS200/IS605 family transposase [Bacteroidota bacterium]